MAAQAHPRYVLYLQPPTARCWSPAQHRELLGMGETTARSQPPAGRSPTLPGTGLPPRRTGRLFLALDTDQLCMIQGTGRHPEA